MSEIRLTPNVAVPGTRIAFYGSAFPKLTTVHVFFGAIATPVASVRSDGAGAISGSLVVPTVAPAGPAMVRTTVDSSAAAWFTVTSAPVPPPPTPGPSRRLIPAYVRWKDFTGVGNAAGDPGTLTDDVLAYMGGTLGLGGLMVSSPGLPSITGTAPPNNGADLTGKQTVDRCRTHGLTKLYMGLMAVKASNPTPYVEWFDEAAWTRLLDELRQAATSARLMGFDGLWFDNETPNSGPTWRWDYPGNTHDQAQTRVQVRLRGTQAMAALVSGWVGAPRPIEVVNYASFFNGGYSQKIRPGIDFDATQVHIDWHAGMASFATRGAYRFANADFYVDGTGAEMVADRHGVEANLTAKGVSPRDVHEVPFLWLGPSDGDGGGYYTAEKMSPGHGFAQVQAALAATDQEFYTFHYGADFNHQAFSAFTPAAKVSWSTPGNFEPAYQAASR